jgi:competence protein ComEC
MMGDLDGPGEAQVVAWAADLRSLLLKAPHHGSRNAAGEALLRRVQPRWAVVSVGRNNPFGNPSVETLQRLLRSGARPLLTSDQGAITLETDGIKYLLSSYRCGVLDAGELPPHF